MLMFSVDAGVGLTTFRTIFAELFNSKSGLCDTGILPSGLQLPP